MNVSQTNQPVQDDVQDVTPPENSFARFVLHSEYQRISLEHVARVEECEERRSRIVLPPLLAHETADPEELQALFDSDQLEDQANEARLIAVVFAAMCLEAFIYDYGAMHLSETHSTSLDRLDPVARWMIFPRLVTGSEIAQKSHVMGAIKRLFAVRNKLVHYKSSDLDMRRIDQQLQKRKKDYHLEPREIRLALTEPFRVLKTLHTEAGVVWYHANMV
jgi:hypothetical protein